MKSSQVPLKNLPMVGTTMVGHIHIMIIELLMKLDVILKNVGCTVTKMLDQNNMPGVVKNLGEEFYFLRAGTAVYGVIYDEHIKPVFAGKRFDGLLDDS